MRPNVTVFDIMIASAGDVKDEREAIVEAIRKWNSNHLEKTNVMLRALTWEVDAPRGVAEDVQSIIDEKLVESSDMVIALFWKTLGRKTPSNKKITYTIGEIQKHIENNKPVVIHFKKIDAAGGTPKETKAIEKVQAFKENLFKYLGKNCLYWEFKDLSDFQIDSRLEKDIEYHLLDKNMTQQTSMNDAFTIISQHHKMEYIDLKTYRCEKEIKVRAKYNGVKLFTDSFLWNANGKLEYKVFGSNNHEYKVVDHYLELDGRHHYSIMFDRGTIAGKEYTLKIQRTFSETDVLNRQFLCVIGKGDGIVLDLELKVPKSLEIFNLRYNQYHYDWDENPYKTEDLKLSKGGSIIYPIHTTKLNEKYEMVWEIQEK